MFFLISFLIIILLLFKTKRSLHMLQQNLYNENNRYIKWNFRNISQFLNIEIIIILLTMVGLFMVYNLRLYSLIVLIAISLLYLIWIVIFRKSLKSEKTKKPLVYTKRIKRLIITTSLL